MIGIITEINFKNALNELEVYENILNVLARNNPNEKWMFQKDPLIMAQCNTKEIVSNPTMVFVENKKIVMVCDGEIYNHDELKDLGIFAKSDEEYFIQAYLKFGVKFLEKINGVFALAIYDERDESLFIARDRMGIRPLFYTIDESKFFMASEIKGILAYPKFKACIDKNEIIELFSIGPGRTLGNGVFKGINELLPATCGYVKNGKLLTWHYWQLKDQPWIHDLETTKKMIKELVVEAINKSIPNEGEICCFMSGGLDSSIVGKVMADKSSDPITTISVEYQDNDLYFKPTFFQPNSDGHFIELMKNELGSEHHSIVIQNEMLADGLLESMIARDLPGMADVDSSLLLFCKEAKNLSDLAITGECSDEIFGGYPWYREEKMLNAELFPWAKDLDYRLSFLKDDFKLIDARDYIIQRINKTKSNADVLPYQTDSEKKMKQMMKLNLDWFMMCLVDRGDRISRSTNMDIRIPFCDYRIVEMLYHIPWEMKNIENREKGLLRDAVKDLLPEEIVYRKKSPYPKTHHPKYWDRVKVMLREIIDDPTSPLLKIVVKEKLEELLNKNEQVSWYGQLMTTPQTIAYFIQMNMWLKYYNIEIID